MNANVYIYVLYIFHCIWYVDLVDAGRQSEFVKEGVSGKGGFPEMRGSESDAGGGGAAGVNQKMDVKMFIKLVCVYIAVIVIFLFVSIFVFVLFLYLLTCLFAHLIFVLYRMSTELRN